MPNKHLFLPGRSAEVCVHFVYSELARCGLPATFAMLRRLLQCIVCEDGADISSRGPVRRRGVHKARKREKNDGKKYDHLFGVYNPYRATHQESSRGSHLRRRKDKARGLQTRASRENIRGQQL